MRVISFISTGWQEILQDASLLRSGPGHVSVIAWPVSNSATSANWKLLDAEERIRAERFVYEQHRDRFVASHSGVRRILERILGRDAAKLCLLADANGKPQLAGDSIQFNLTHSEDWAALAVSRDMQVGIDLERIRPVEKNLPQHYFSIQEQSALATLAGEDWLPGFFCCWTRKEALLKAVGAGLSLSLEAFTVTVEPNTPAILLGSSLEQLQPRDWSMLHLGCIPGYIGALVVPRGLQQVSVFVASSGIDGEVVPR